MVLNGKAGGSKSGFLKQVGTWKRDSRVRELVGMGIPVVQVAKKFGISKARVYQLMRRERTVVEDGGYFWSWIFHADRVKSKFPATWKEFCDYWKERRTPEKPAWVLAYEVAGR